MEALRASPSRENKEIELQLWERQPRNSMEKASVVLGLQVTISSGVQISSLCEYANLESAADMNNCDLHEEESQVCT